MPSPASQSERCWAGTSEQAVTHSPPTQQGFEPYGKVLGGCDVCHRSPYTVGQESGCEHNSSVLVAPSLSVKANFPRNTLNLVKAQKSVGSNRIRLTHESWTNLRIEMGFWMKHNSLWLLVPWNKIECKLSKKIFSIIFKEMYLSKETQCHITKASKI